MDSKVLPYLLYSTTIKCDSWKKSKERSFVCSRLEAETECVGKKMKDSLDSCGNMTGRMNTCVKRKVESNTFSLLSQMVI